jgi:hypothetical protein
MVHGSDYTALTFGHHRTARGLNAYRSRPLQGLLPARAAMSPQPTRIPNAPQVPREWLRRRIEICDACGQWLTDRCSLNRRMTSCHRRRPLAVCPASPPKWGPVAPAPTLPAGGAEGP